MPKRPGLVSRQWNVSLVTAALMLANLMLAGAAGAAQPGQLFGAPLNFGMSADEASAALGVRDGLEVDRIQGGCGVARFGGKHLAA